MMKMRGVVSVCRSALLDTGTPSEDKQFMLIASVIDSPPLLDSPLGICPH